jgi:hypothetical protein
MLSSNQAHTVKRNLLQSLGLVSMLMACAVGCGAAEAGSQTEDISAAEAAQALPSSHLILKGESSGLEAAKLGVASWDVYAFLNQDIEQNGASKTNAVAAFGVDKNGEVLYLVTLEEESLKITKVAPNGDALPTSLSEGQTKALMTDVATFAPKLSASEGALTTMAADAKSTCSIGFARGLLATVVVVAGGGIVVGGLALAGSSLLVVTTAGEVAWVTFHAYVAGASIAAAAGGAVLMTSSWGLRAKSSLSSAVCAKK